MFVVDVKETANIRRTARGGELIFKARDADVGRSVYVAKAAVEALIT